jgi:hypothetical protein
LREQLVADAKLRQPCGASNGLEEHFILVNAFEGAVQITAVL